MPASLSRRFYLSVVAVAALLSACGGGGTDTKPKVAITQVKVMGDSLADAGTFGRPFTILNSDTNGVTTLYPDRVAASYSLEKTCNYFAFNGTTFILNTKAGCTNYAIGGGVINPASATLTATDPRAVSVQFAAATQAGNFAATDLLVVDGGGNDAAALVTAYLSAVKDQGASYAALLGSVLTPAQVGAAAAGGTTGLAAAGNTYMGALADKFYDLIKTGALDKGAQHVVVLNVPAITLTPRFQSALNDIAAAYGGGTAGATARAQSDALFTSWVASFNTQLAKRAAGESRVAVVDFNTEFSNQVAHPAQFGLTNVTTPACITGFDANCTTTYLAAHPGAGLTADWYKTWLFSDGFHPTLYGHQLLAQLISRSLAQAGWL